MSKTYENLLNTISKKGLKIAIAKAGDMVTFSAEPNLGYKLAAVTVGGKNVYEAGRETYTFEMPGNNIVISAVYAETDAFSLSDDT